MLLTMKWENGILSLLDQTKLPVKTQYLDCTDYQMVADAIRRLVVRGAPAIGAAAGYGMVLAARQFAELDRSAFSKAMAQADAELRSTRPTAVNLFWALDRLKRRLSDIRDEAPAAIIAALEAEAEEIAAADKRINAAMAANGAALFHKPTAVLTHCNAGALATVAIGTALGVIRKMHSEGKLVRVYADETRPLLQGARLTAFELASDHIPVTLITDNMAGWVMRNHRVDAVIVGADRIAANGDTANKIGTYSVAVLAKQHQIPFYIAAPASTFDFTLATGREIPIEERSRDEVTHVFGVQTAPLDIDVYNPAFDVTPHELITGIITEYGVLSGDYISEIKKLQEKLKGDKK